MSSDNDVRRIWIRRQKERRSNDLAFNSPEWIAMMQESFVLWPKLDRRKEDRRACERRKLDRRSLLRKEGGDRHFPVILTADNVLDDEEKRMILDLFKNQ